MAVPKRYAHNYVPIKHMLSSYRALLDGRGGIQHLEEMLERPQFIFSTWKVVWLGVCATLRSSIDLFRIDSRSCLSAELRAELQVEWEAIKANADSHEIYWEFLKKERDNIVHEYKWSAYEAWMKPDGTMEVSPTVLGLLFSGSDARPVLMMKNGRFEGQDSIQLLASAADWVEERILSAISRAGYDPDERRSAYDFQLRPEGEIDPSSLLGRYLNVQN